MRLLCLSLCLALLAAPAAAGCFGAGQGLMRCTVKEGARQLDLCLQGGVLIYRYGPPEGPAEMLLARPVTEVDMLPWPGIGRYFWEVLTLYNGPVAYELYVSADRLDLEAPAEGGVTVIEDGEALAQLTCDPGTLSEMDLYPVFEAKEAAGQRYCPESQSWDGAC
ncbi:hypothetical protein [Roseivivax sp.]